MDSGVETGNDSNDSSATQHENLVAMNSIGVNGQMQSNIINVGKVVSLTNGNSIADVSSDIILPQETASHKSLSSSSQNQNTSNSLVSVSSLTPEPFLSLALVPANDKAKIFELLIPPSYNSEYPLPGTIDYLKPQSRYHLKRRRNIQRWNDKYINVSRMRLAAATNNIERMQSLLSKGVSPNDCDSQGRTPLHIASCRGYTEMVELLLTYGADPNIRDCIGNTPLHLAAVTSKISVVTLLLKAGTDVLSSDCHGLTPLQLAQMKLRVLQHYKGSDMTCIKEEVRNVIVMLLVYLQKQNDAREEVEALSSLCSRLSLSNTSDQLQDDVRSLLANIDMLSLKN